MIPQISSLDSQSGGQQEWQWQRAGCGEAAAYVVGLLVRLHGFGDVLHTLDGAFHLRVFHQRRVEARGRGCWLPRNVRDVDVFREDLLVLLLFGRSFHCGEEHEIWDGLDKNLTWQGNSEGKKEKGGRQVKLEF